MAAPTTRAMPRRCWERTSAIRQSTRAEVEASAEQLADEGRGIGWNCIAPPGDMLIGARKNELVIRIRGGGLDGRGRHAGDVARGDPWCDWYNPVVERQHGT